MNMRMFIEVFVLCLLAQSQFCISIAVQPAPTERGIVPHSSNILALINDARKCGAYAGTSDLNDLTACDRPVQVASDPKEYIDYSLVLCMVLYDAVQRVCKTKQNFTNLKQNVSDNFCDIMTKTFPERSSEKSDWVSLLRGKFENSDTCKQECIQGKLINPICDSILAANIFTMEKQKPPTIRAGNPGSLMNLLDPGIGKDINTKKHKFLKVTSVSPEVNDRSPKIDVEGVHNISEAHATQDNVVNMLHTTYNQTSEVTQQSDIHGHVTEQPHISNNNKYDYTSSEGDIQDTVIKQADKKKTSHDAPHQGSGSGMPYGANQVYVKNTKAPPGATGQASGGAVANFIKQANPTNMNIPSDDAKHQYSGNGVPDGTKQENTTNRNNSSAKGATNQASGGGVPKVGKQTLTTDRSNSSDDKVPQSPGGDAKEVTKEAHLTNEITLSDDAKHNKEKNKKPGAGKHEDSSGIAFSADSKSNRSEQNSADDDTVYLEKQNDDGNEDSVVPTKMNTLGSDMIDHDDVDQDDSINADIPGISFDKEDIVVTNEKILINTENRQEATGNHNTAQFNQLGDTQDSHFYAYFMTMVVICIIGYLLFHNKQKILALALEGRSRRGTRRRPNTSGYRKLDSNLEEAVTSKCSTSVTHVIY
ncbi:uncharacterized protein LOC110839305 isoform X2 [Zootermopsis nevadensis]|uniref:uncharacterized protein LOC110839305 isoform X2 n=1 Tax=Zootermopsis nevadensis TaxID=136037 RepID=UPI000B8E42ED|nr:uncharacterized protein LOC110839305 isoform X2 [Zootermopsis nevadensis]